MRNFRGGVEKFFLGGVEKFSGFFLGGGYEIFGGGIEKCSGGGGIEKFSGERVENFFFWGGGVLRNFKGGNIILRGVKFFSVEVTFFREGLAIFWGPG